MSDSTTDKQPCQACGAMILPSTAEETDGLCMPCHQGRDPQDRSLGGLKTTPLQTMLGGLGIIAVGVLVFFLFTWFESSSSGSVRVHWLIAVAYRIGGENVVAGIIIVIGVLVAVSWLWRRDSPDANED